MSSHNKEAADLSNIKLPKHEPTIAIEEILAGYGGSDRQDVWESIQAYADIHARSALTASEAPATEQAPPLPKPYGWFDIRGEAADGYTAEQFRERDAMWMAKIAALSTPPAVPPGHVIVPAEPTDKMTFVGQSMRYDSINSIGEIYRAMLSAAPAAPQPQKERPE